MANQNISVKDLGNSGVNIILEKDGYSKFRTHVSNGTLGNTLDSLLKGKKLLGILDIDADREEDVDFIIRIAKDYLYVGEKIQISVALQEIRERMTPQAKQYYGLIFKRILGIANNNPVQFVHRLNKNANKNNENENNMHEGGKKKQKRRGSRKSSRMTRRKTRRTNH